MEVHQKAKRQIIIQRQRADAIFFDIAREEWLLPYDVLGRFCRSLYDQMVDRYKELERSKEYPVGRSILTVWGLDSEKSLAFCDGFGSTARESVCTHGVGWGLDRLLRYQKEFPEPCDFHLLMVGYRGKGSGGDEGEPLPLFGKVA